MHAYYVVNCFILQLFFGYALASPSHYVKRGAETNATLYAYGVNASSWPIAYGLDDGVLPFTRIAYVNGTVTGFALFASQLVYNNNTELEAQFWAKSTNITGVYGLIWTPDGDIPTGDFPVVVKASEDF
ncbi:uncharacterized protein N7511_003151 [Penicillium nucicola]|uniref:uncharacterized protein n=1 Tax=Penicillium nucicola TaxID=1850975 RepID=UPI002544D60A|nr:uncharacterized protein N7511_003151 [Penicillium nucicola]KAJ5771100.1 hypothetical protein N7511_003151 [Penicillium nucicola]